MSIRENNVLHELRSANSPIGDRGITAQHLLCLVRQYTKI